MLVWDDPPGPDSFPESESLASRCLFCFWRKFWSGEDRIGGEWTGEEWQRTAGLGKARLGLATRGSSGFGGATRNLTGRGKARRDPARQDKDRNGSSSDGPFQSDVVYVHRVGGVSGYTLSKIIFEHFKLEK